MPLFKLWDFIPAHFLPSAFSNATRLFTFSESHSWYATPDDANVKPPQDPSSLSTSRPNSRSKLDGPDVAPLSFSSSPPHGSSQNNEPNLGVSVNTASHSENQEEQPQLPAAPSPLPIVQRTVPKNPVEYVLSGQELLLSYEGISQYAKGDEMSESGGGLTALNFSRAILEKTKKGVYGTQLLEEIISEKTIEEIISIHPMLKGSAHRTFDEILQLPIFDVSLECKDISLSTATRKGIDQLVERMERAKEDYYASIMVIAEETNFIACLVFDIDGTNVFAIFDSYPQRLYLCDADITISTNRDKFLDRLQNLLGVYEELPDDPNLAWQIEMLFQFSAHNMVMVARSNNLDLNELLLRLSVESRTKKKDYEEQLKQVRKERDAAKKDLEDFRHAFRFQKDKNELKEALKQALDAHSGLLQESQVLKQRLKEHKEKNYDFEKQLKRIRMERDAAKEDLKNLSHTYNSQKEEYRALFADGQAKYGVLYRRWKDDNARMTKKTSELEQSLELANLDRGNLLQERENLKTEVRSLEDELGSTQSMLKELLTQKAELLKKETGGLKQIVSNEAGHNKMHKRWKEDISEARMVVQAAAQELMTSRGERMELVRQVEELKSKLDEHGIQ